MNMKNPIVFLILSCILISSILSSCSADDSSDSELDNNINTSEQIRNGETETVINTYDAHLPDMDLDGMTIRLLNMDEADMWWTIILACPETESGEVINDAIYTRNRMIEEKYNIAFTEVRLPAGQIVSSVSNSVNAGSDEYDIIMPFSYNIDTLALQGMLYDLNTLPYIDFDKPWWSSSVNEFSISGKVYFAISDFLLSDKENVSILMYNKKIADDLGLMSDTELYQVVTDGNWVLDDFMDMIKSASTDLNGNGVADNDDRYGLMTADYWAYAALVAMAGEQFVTKDSNDIPVFSANTERFINVYEKMINLMNTREYVTRQYIDFDKDYSHVEWGMMFTDDKALFCNEVLASVRLYNGMESDFAVIPMPKFDDRQDRYYSYSIWATCIGIPITVTEPDNVALVLEASSALSRELVIPAYYEVAIAVKYFRDEMSFKMLDIILENEIYDVLRMVYDWGGFDTAFKNFASSGKTDIVSLIESNESKVTLEIQKTIDTYNNLP